MPVLPSVPEMSGIYATGGASVFFGFDDVPAVEFMYLVRVTAGDSGLCCLRLCVVLRALINSPCVLILFLTKKRHPLTESYP